MIQVNPLSYLMALGKAIGGRGSLGIIIGVILVIIFTLLYRKYIEHSNKKAEEAKQERERKKKEEKEYLSGTPKREKEVLKLLQKEESDRPKKIEVGSKKCPNCSLINPISSMKCDCGYLFVKTEN